MCTSTSIWSFGVSAQLNQQRIIDLIRSEVITLGENRCNWLHHGLPWTPESLIGWGGWGIWFLWGRVSPSLKSSILIFPLPFCRHSQSLFYIPFILHSQLMCFDFHDIYKHQVLIALNPNTESRSSHLTWVWKAEPRALCKMFLPPGSSVVRSPLHQKFYWLDNLLSPKSYRLSVLIIDSFHTSSWQRD